MNAVREIRRALRLSQVELGMILGVHFVTVSKWERDKLSPSSYQTALLYAMREAAKNDPDIGHRASVEIRAAGEIRALYLLLDAAFYGEKR